MNAMFRVFIFSVAGYLACTSIAEAADAGLISFVDKPVLLIRDVALHLAGAGVPLQIGDMIETAEGSMQIEGLGGTILSLGPNTRIYLGNAEMSLLEGWVKLQSSGVAIAIGTPRLRLPAASGTVIIHVTFAREEIFVVEGSRSVTELDSRRETDRDLKLEREQYLVRLGDAPGKISTRPDSEFIAEMPRGFLDPLVTVAERLKGRVGLKKEKDVGFSDVEPWLTSNVGLRKRLVTRFIPRLKDRTFRHQLDSRLGQTPEWKPVLHPAPEKR